MLTALELENFKGISGRQRLELAPITLLFGANNAGKSTILQALLYLSELLEHGDADVDRTTLGGQVVELGGFGRLVHGHDRSRTIRIRAEFRTPGTLERFGRLDDELAFPELDDTTDRAWIELSICDRAAAGFRGPLIDVVEVGLGDVREPIVTLQTGRTLRDGEPLTAIIDADHAALEELRSVVEERWLDAALGYQPPSNEEVQTFIEGLSRGTLDLDHSGHLTPGFAIARSRLSALPPLAEPIRVFAPDDEGPEAPQALVEIRMFLEMVVLGTTAQLSSRLKSMLYLGPLRAIPPRGFLYERRGRLTSWADGLAAWDMLLADRTSLVERTNAWLDRLGAGCKVVVQELLRPGASAEAIAASHPDDTVRRLLLHTSGSHLVLPAELGAGISQLIPVVVAAVADQRTELVAIEQPEIHVHPALQVELGDLFIEASRDRRLLIETHSEHLMLRLLRRIRETTAGELASGAPPLEPEALSVLHVAATPDGVVIKRLWIDPQGEFTTRWPKGFFEERAEELF